MKLLFQVFLVAVGIAATFAADSAASNYPNTDPYYRNNYNNNNYYRNDPYHRNDYNRNNPYYRNDYNRNNGYYNNDYDRYNNNNPYNRNDYNRYNVNDQYNRYNKYNTYDQYNKNYNKNQYNTGAEAQARILSYESNIRPDGTYEYSYNTDNGISAAESGAYIQYDAENGASNVQGQFDYTSPEGIPVKVRYTADENGFHPEGSHLPTNGIVPSNDVFRSGKPISSNPASAK